MVRFLIGNILLIAWLFGYEEYDLLHDLRVLGYNFTWNR